ncbi:hypoxanthine phosphoribosyltransferase, partial [Coprococcus sp. MSK.21.13]|nr:hypoxanthine phosphoribosyltransferase [Coprococcus sp. MSK.21.13]
MEEKTRNILITSEEIQKKVEVMGKKISEDYEGKNLYVLSLLRGSFIFAADLVRSITVPTKIGFMTTSSYGHEEVSTGKVK